MLSRRIVSTTLALGASLVALPCASVFAARWTYHTVADGLPDNSVQALAQTLDGAVWAGTPTGLARFDGAWAVISSESIRSLTVDGAGDLWAGSAAGQVGIFSPDGAARALPAELQTPLGDRVADLAAGPRGEVWLGVLVDPGDGLLLRWHDPGGGFVLEEIWRGPVYAVDVDGTGRPWWGSSDGLWTLDDSGLAELVALPVVDSRDKIVVSVMALADGSVVLGTLSGGAWWYRAGGSVEAIPLPSDLSSPVAALLEDARGRIWIARRDKAYRLDRRAAPEDPSAWLLKTLAAEDGLGGDQLQALGDFESGAAGGGGRDAWFGTDLGASVLSGFAWTVYNTSNGLTGSACTGILSTCDDVTAIAFDGSSGDTWFGARAGLSRLEPDGSWTGWLNQLFGGPLLHPEVRALYVDGGDTLWVATGQDVGGTLLGGLQAHGLDAPDGVWTTLGRSADAPRWFVSALERDAAGELWLATYDGVWRRREGLSELHYGVADGLPSNRLTALDVGTSSVLVGCTGALARYDLGGQTWTALPLAAAGLTDAANVEVRTVLLHGGRLWAATAAGLVSADEGANDLGSAVVLDAAAGLANDIRGIAASGDGFLVVATASGLFRLDEDLSRWARLGVGDGLPGEDLLTVVTRQDEVWVGFEGEGAAVHAFLPPDVRFQLEPPAVLTSGTVPTIVLVDVSDPDSDEAEVVFQWRVDDGVWSAPSSDRSLALVPAALGLLDGVHTLAVRAEDPEFNLDPTPALSGFELDTTPPTPTIQSPGSGEVVAGSVTITGTADDARFHRYMVESWPTSLGAAAAETIVPWSATPVVAGVLAQWETSGRMDDLWTLKVTVVDDLGVTGSTQIEVLVDNQAPFADVTSPVDVLGSAGATVYSADGRAVAFLPPFAFSGLRTITLEREAGLESEAVVAYRLGPEPLDLVKPATLQIGAPEGAPAITGLALCRWEGDRWLQLGGSAQAETGRPALALSVEQTGLYALRTREAAPTPAGTLIQSLAAEPRLLEPRSGGLDGRMTISFELQRPARVEAVIYNRAGRARKVLAEGLELGAGRQLLFWDGRDADGEIVAAGLYIVCVEAGDERVTRVVSVGRR